MNAAFALRFGENLALHRQRVGISQEELGFRAELHRTAVSQLERGIRVPRADTVVKLAGTLGVSTEALFDGLSWKPGTWAPGAMGVEDRDAQSR